MSDANDWTSVNHDSEDETFAAAVPLDHYKPGDLVDGAYRLNAPLGHGGMGIVFACTHLALGKDYAIKLLPGGKLSKEHWLRFQSEAKALARLNHPGIVGIHNMGIDRELWPYYVMDLLSGETLDALIAKARSLPLDDALQYFIQVANALGRAHSQGVIHRDIKPSNLMLVRDERDKIDRVKIVDFGIARVSKHGLDTQSQTATGLIFGTPFYMSPEQCQGKKVDQRSDIYSFGCTLFEALTGSPPFKGENAFTTFMMHQSEPPPTLSQAAPTIQFPQSLEQALAKMLSKNAGDRYQTMEQVEHDLERIRSGKEIMARGLAHTRTGLPAANVTEQSTIDHNKADGSQKQSRDPIRGASPIIKLGLILVPTAALIGACLFVIQLQKPQAKTMPHAKMTYELRGPAEKTEGGSAGDKDSKVESDSSPGVLQRIGCTAKEIAFLQQEDDNDVWAEHKTGVNTFKKFLDKSLADHTHFFNKDHSLLTFPPKVAIGAIRFGDGQPVFATGTIKVPKNKPVCFYQNHCLIEFPRFIELFGPEDLTGLELTVEHPKEILDKIKDWKNLKELSFYNSLIKPMPGLERVDESQLRELDLPDIDRFQKLERLGLCNFQVSGSAIARMGLLHSLTSLKVKNIRDIEGLLKVLPPLDNLHEITLFSEETTDSQLDYLAKMKNLEILTINRSLLTPQSLATFQKMKSLKRLVLDCNWTDADKARFKSTLQHCEFVSVVDPSFWHVIDDGKSPWPPGSAGHNTVRH